MRVGHHLLAQRSFARLVAPVLSEGNEELLIAGESIVHWSGLALERCAVAVIRSGDAGYVRDVFCKRLPAVDVHIRKRLIGVVLRGELCGGGFEVGEVGGRPPVADATLGVERRTFRVEGVTDFVADDRTDRSIV